MSSSNFRSKLQDSKFIEIIKQQTGEDLQRDRSDQKQVQERKYFSIPNKTTSINEFKFPSQKHDSKDLSLDKDQLLFNELLKILKDQQIENEIPSILIEII